MGRKIYFTYAITDDGEPVYSTPGGKAHLVTGSPRSAIQGKDEAGQKVIDELDLNSTLEIQFRKYTDLIHRARRGETSKCVSVFGLSVGQILVLNRRSSGQPKNSQNLLRGMLYANVFTALESLLSDYLIESVRNDEAIRSSLVSRYDDFNTKKFTLRNLIAEGKSAEELVLEKLQYGVVYHNLGKVYGMYNAAFGIEFPDFEALARALVNRQDIVHRNGVARGVDTERIYNGKARVEDIAKIYTHGEVLQLVVDAQLFVIELLKKLAAR